ILDAYLPEVRSVLGDETTYVKVHPREARRLQAGPEEPLWGPPVESVTVEEYGVRYVIRPAAGWSVGLFLDMREVRQWLRAPCAGVTVLNLFAYTCSLGVSAILGGASRVLNL